MKYLKLYENFDWDEDDFDFEEEQYNEEIILSKMKNIQDLNLKIGDKLLITNFKKQDKIYQNITGTIIEINKTSQFGFYFFTIRFDIKINGNKNGYDWNFTNGNKNLYDLRFKIL